MIRTISRLARSRMPLAICLTGATVFASAAPSRADAPRPSWEVAVATLVRQAGSRPAGVIHVPTRLNMPAAQRWIEENRTSLEGTQPGPFDPTAQYVSTLSGHLVFVHILDWQGKNNVTLPPVIDRPVQKAWLLQGGAPVRVDQGPWGMTVVVPEDQRPNDFDTVVVLQMPGDLEDLRQPRLVSARPAKAILLYGDHAKLVGKGIRYVASPDWIEGWTSTSDAVVWNVRAPSAGRYSVAMTYSCAPGCEGVPIEIAANGRSHVTAITAQTEGVWSGWQAFERRTVPGSLRLDRGANSIVVRALGTGHAREIIRLNEITLTSPEAQRAASAAAQRARAVRADAGWLRRASYGVMVHWLPNSMPRTGPRKPYCEAVRDFDVERFADMIKDTGADYLIFTLAQLQYFPMPLRAADAVMPGRTCPGRDLIGDLASALERRRLRLVLYYHHGVGDTEWAKAAGFLQPDKSRFFRNEAAILTEIGERYGPRLSGWWFDDRYPMQPFERLDGAAKAGDPGRLVAFNSWILPKSTDFQDYWAGEMGGELHYPPSRGFFGPSGPAGGLQPHVLIYLDDGWVHGAPDTPIAPPRFTDAELIGFVRAWNRAGGPVTMNIGVYQDGTASPATLNQLDAVRRAIRGH